MTEKENPKPASKRPGLWLAVVGAAVACALLAAAGITWRRLTSLPLPQAAEGATFTVRRGESLGEVARELASRGIVVHAWDLVVLGRLQGEGTRIQAGEYRIRSGTTAAGLLDQLVRGRVLLHRFTIVPGTTYSEVFASLESNPAIAHTLASLDGKEVMQRLGHPGESPEGMFFPDTYFFARGTSDRRLLERAYNSMRTYLETAWPDRATGLPFTNPYAALILASIIEKETAVPAERAEIAGVFVRRLERGMRLDADPTVIYGLGAGYQGHLGRADLARDTPYNTYLHSGLPPSPICMPGAATIKAALHPQSGTALYFVAKGDGTHVFSDTLAEQQQMIRKYEFNRSGGGGNSGGSGTLHHP